MAALSCSDREHVAAKPRPDDSTEPAVLRHAVEESEEGVTTGHPPESMKDRSDLFDDEQLRELALQAEKDPDSLVADRFAESSPGRTRLRRERLTALERAEALAPTDARVQVLRGKVLSELGRIGDACEAYARAVELDPKTSAWRVLHEKALFFADRFADVVEVYRRTLKAGFGDSRAPLEVRAHWYGGWAFLYLERYAEARECFEAL